MPRPYHSPALQESPVRDPTDLEHIVLGIIAKKGPITAYAVMQEFTHSTAAHYRASAGAIYPLVRRLVRRRLIMAGGGARGRRAHTAYVIGVAGRAALRAWLSPPLPADAAGLAIDPLRTRMYFLASVPPQQRVAFVDDALRLVEAEMRANVTARNHYRATGDPFSTLAMDGALRVMRARRQWLRGARRMLAQESRKKPRNAR
jgi:DNA-binding PadR family transcriptional regulator